MIEENTRYCKVCFTPKKRILQGRYPNGKDSIWVDDFGRQWSGKVCPDCHAKRSKSTMKKIRAK